MSDNAVIGKSVKRQDLLAKVTGDAKYVADMQLPGLLYARSKRSTIAHALIRRIDPTLARLTPVTDYPLLGPDGAVESFAGLPKVPIVNLISLIRRSSSMRLRDALRVDNTLGQAMMAYDPVATYAKYDHLSAREFLDRLGFPPRARQMLFDVFSHSFFNPEAELSAAELMMMFHFYFIGNPEGIVFDGVDHALQVPGTDIRLFGKPESFRTRRMGVALARAEDVDTARRNAAEAAGRGGAQASRLPLPGARSLLPAAV